MKVVLFIVKHVLLSLYYSAGIGRTGTFIALDVLSRYGKNNGKINIIEYVKAMRKDRMTMIQNVVSMISCINESFVHFLYYYNPFQTNVYGIGKNTNFCSKYII